MGLDSVDLVMEIEEAFDHPIPEEDSVKMSTPGDVFDYLMTTGFKAMPKGPCLSQSLFNRLRRSLTEEFQVDRQQIKPRTAVAALLPQFRIRSRRLKLFQRLGLKRSPPILDSMTFFRRDFGTFGDLSKAILTSNYGVLAEEAGFWNPKEAWDCLRLLIAYQLGVKIDKVTRTANFVNDLGLS